MHISIAHFDSPAGPLILGSIGSRLCLCDWAQCKQREKTDRHIQAFFHANYVIEDSEVIANALSQLEEYFQGYGRRMLDIPLAFAGTPFQQSVWRELLKIPYGSTASYAQIAQRMGCPKAVRAVANAVGANPISIFVPCHRVIGSNGTLTGYAGGLAAKSRLLRLEGSTLPLAL